MHPFAAVPDTVYVVVTLGVTEILEAFDPVFHVYVAAPFAVIVTDCPAQIKLALLEAVTVGLGFTETITLFTLTPQILLPATV